MPVTLGSRLGPYEVVAKLGEGGMGEVYRATDGRLGRDVAIKVLSEAWTQDPERLARFEREAKLLASLNHPNIAAIYGVEESGSATALVMELVEGPTLAERSGHGRVPVVEALSIARQIAEALEEAHGKGIVHRDLKPQNVKLTPDGKVKVLDFGLAKAMDPVTGSASASALAKSPTLTLGATVQGVILGTAAYMAPEQARGLAVDKRADIWAFGVVLFEMLSGRRLFAGELVSDVLANVLKQDIDYALLPEPTPPSVLRLLRRCLVRQPKERLRDIGDARLELDDAALVERPSAPPASPRAGLRRAVFAAGAMLAVLALGVIGGRELRPAPAAETPRMHLQLLPPHEFGFAVPDGPATLSPDGRRIAFVLRGDRPESIWFRAIDSSDAVPVPGSADGYEPFWSPDGRSIGFCQDSLMRYDVETGAPPFAIARVEDAHGATWGTQGVIVYAPAPAGALMRVAATGGAPAPATTLDAARGETAHTRPQFLPDGVHFLYHAASDRAGESAIVVGALDSADTTRVLPLETPARYAPPGYLLYVRGTTLLAQRFDASRLELRGDPLPVTQGVEYIRQFRNPAFSASSNGLLAYHPPAAPAQPTWLDRAGRVHGPVGAIGDRNLDLSPDGTRLAVNADDPQTQKSDVWVIDLVRGVRTRLTSGAGDEFGPVWSVDGERIFFASREGDTTRLVAKRASGVGEEVEILRGTGLGEPIAAFPDGRHLLIETVSAERRGDLEVVDLARGGAREPFVATASHEESGRISPDGRYVAYVSGESGRDEVYVQPFPPTGSRWQISANGGTTPRWRGDGRELFYVEDRQLVAVPVRISPSFGVGTPQPLFRLAERDIVVTGDGQRILAVIPPRVAETTPIEVLVGWDRALAGDGRAP